MIPGDLDKFHGLVARGCEDWQCYGNTPFARYRSRGVTVGGRAGVIYTFLGNCGGGDPARGGQKRKEVGEGTISRQG